MAVTLENLARTAFQTFARSSSDSNALFAGLKDMLRKITIEEVPFKRDILEDPSPFDKARHEAPVGYFPILEVDEVFSMGVFILRTGVRLPLHDHPYMTGLVKVLSGNLQVETYNQSSESVPDTLRAALQPWRKIVPVSQNPPLVLGPADDPCELSPNLNNFHEIRSLDGPAAFLDILAPPYSNSGGPRTCTYYKVLNNPSSDQSSIKFLVEVPQPPDFHCQEVLAIKRPQQYATPGPENNIPEGSH